VGVKEEFYGGSFDYLEGGIEEALFSLRPAKNH